MDVRCSNCIFYQRQSRRLGLCKNPKNGKVVFDKSRSIQTRYPTVVKSDSCLTFVGKDNLAMVAIAIENHRENGCELTTATLNDSGHIETVGE